ncbi:uncharacterized protein EAF01_007732 [Botrytis porri]|uniref:uncharacterized protein n=1 Tax=Botrytis porri TaxID=87229 RepID=UPI001902BA3F|nr:uncharacterized protein EAF01_007732 [Botrytis porri]KAF7900430.1 hypothetical protein EAF01_007732 [Botrytis porri]
MYTQISQLTTALAILFTLTTALPAPLDTNTKISSCSTDTVDSTCIDTYNTCMTAASGNNDAIASCAVTLSTCTSASAKRDEEKHGEESSNSLYEWCVGKCGVCGRVWHVYEGGEWGGGDYKLCVGVECV